MSQFAKGRKRSSRSLLSRLCRRCRPALQRGVRASKADRYVKRYRSAEFALSLIVLFLKGLDSLRALHAALEQGGLLAKDIRLGGISNAQLAQMLHRRPTALWASLLSELLAQVAGVAAPSALRLLDSSLFKLGARLMSRRWQRAFVPWAAGIKLTMVIDPAQCAPVCWQISAGGGSDAAQGPAVLPEGDISGQIYLFDRGFRNYGFFQQLINRGADFVTRASAQLRYTLLEDLPLQRQQQIVCDQRVILGSHNAHNRMKSPVRRIVLRTDKGEMVFISSLFDLSAMEVCELYRRRWQIELFFRWLKRQVGCIRPLGYSLQAAEHTLLAALAAYLLVLLVALSQHPPHQKRIAMAPTLHRLRADLDRPPQTTYLRALRL